MVLRIAIATVVAPALVAVGVLFIARLVERRRPRSDGWGGVGLGLGYVVGYLGILGWPRFPPVEVTQWLVYAAGVSILFGIAEPFWRRKLSITWAVRFLLMSVTIWLLLRPLIAYSWSARESMAWVAGVTVGVLSLWKILEELGRKFPQWFLGILLVVLGTVESIVLLLANSAVLAQLQGVLTAAMGATLVFGWRYPKGSLSFRAGIPTVTMIFAAHAVGGVFYAEMSGSSVLLLGLAPLMVLLFWRKIGGVLRLSPDAMKGTDE